MTQTPAQIRQSVEEQLAPLGAERREALARVKEIEDRLKPVIKRARRMEVPVRRITELTGVAGNTVGAWTR